MGNFENCVQRYLREKGYLSNDILNGIKFKNLFFHLRSIGGTSISDKIATKLGFLLSLETPNIIKHGSPHFWFLINQFYTSKIDAPRMIEHLLLDLQIAVFDSFYDFLPSEFAIDAFGHVKLNCFFPTLGFIITTPLWSLDKNVLFSTDANFEVARHIKPNLKHVVIKSLEHHRYFSVINDASIYYSEYAKTNIVEPNQIFADDLSRAMDLIALYDPQLKELINRKLKHIVFIPKGKRLSFTDSRLPETIFIALESYKEDIYLLAATIIHEFSHLEFAAFLNCVQFNSEDDRLYYSPWRDDPRPLHGLIHGMYVFTAVFCFLSKARESLSTVSNEMRILIYHQLNFVHLQPLYTKSLTPIGVSVVNDLKNVLERFSQDSIKESIEPNYVNRHKNHFGSRNV